jgi:hypothetical protein
MRSKVNLGESMIQFPAAPRRSLSLGRKKKEEGECDYDSEDLRRVSIVFVGIVPWVYDTISHKFGVGFTLCRFGHTGRLARFR